MRLVFLEQLVEHWSPSGSTSLLAIVSAYTFLLRFAVVDLELLLSSCLEQYALHYINSNCNC